MIILFKDHENPQTKKGVSELLIRGLGQVDNLAVYSGDSIAIPLRNNYEFTQFEFTLNTSSPTLSDSLQINHRQFDTYINRACGYKSNFVSRILSTKTHPKKGWVKRIEKIRDTLSDEKVHIWLFIISLLAAVHWTTAQEIVEEEVVDTQKGKRNHIQFDLV